MATLQNRNSRIPHGFDPRWFQPFLYYGSELDIGPKKLLGVLNGKGKQSRQLKTLALEIKSLRENEPLTKQDVASFYRRLDRINELMRRCVLYPHIEVDRDFRLLWHIRADLDRQSMTDLLRLIVGLLDHRGEFGSLDQCKRCGEWFVKEKTWQQHCSEKCRRETYRRTEAYREKNKIKRREEYKKQRESLEKKRAALS